MYDLFMDLLPESEMSVNEAVASVHEMYQRGHKSLKGAWKHKRQFEEFYWSKVGAANLLNSMVPLGDCERGRLLSIVTDVSHVEPSQEPHSLSVHHRGYGYTPEFVCDASGYWHQRNYADPEKKIYEERIHQLFNALVAKNPSLNKCRLSHSRLYSSWAFTSLSVCSSRNYVDELHRWLNDDYCSRLEKLCRVYGINPSKKCVVRKNSLSYISDQYEESIDEVLKSIDWILIYLSKNLTTKIR